VFVVAHMSTTSFAAKRPPPRLTTDPLASTTAENSTPTGAPLSTDAVSAPSTESVILARIMQHRALAKAKTTSTNQPADHHRDPSPHQQSNQAMGTSVSAQAQTSLTAQEEHKLGEHPVNRSLREESTQAQARHASPPVHTTAAPGKQVAPVPNSTDRFVRPFRGMLLPPRIAGNSLPWSGYTLYSEVVTRIMSEVKRAQTRAEQVGATGWFVP
jgi:hypothetical protein